MAGEDHASTQEGGRNPAAGPSTEQGPTLDDIAAARRQMQAGHEARLQHAARKGGHTSTSPRGASRPSPEEQQAQHSHVGEVLEDALQYGRHLEARVLGIHPSGTDEGHGAGGHPAGGGGGSQQQPQESLLDQVQRAAESGSDAAETAAARSLPQHFIERRASPPCQGEEAKDRKPSTIASPIEEEGAEPVLGAQHPPASNPQAHSSTAGREAPGVLSRVAGHVAHALDAATDRMTETLVYSSGGAAGSELEHGMPAGVAKDNTRQP